MAASRFSPCAAARRLSARISGTVRPTAMIINTISVANDATNIFCSIHFAMRGVFQALGRQFHDFRQISEISRPKLGLKMQSDLKTKNCIGIRKY